MTILVENTLSGELGLQVTNAHLAASAEVGTVTIASPGARATYSSTHTIYDLPAVRVDSGHHRGDTPRLQLGLPGPVWSARWYVWHPSIPAGTGERRWVAAVGGVSKTGVTSYQNASGEIGLRIQPPDLAAAEVAPTFSGTPPGPDGWLRFEVACDGTSTTVRIYPEHATSGHRQMVFTGQALTGALELSGYRFRRRTTLYPVGMGYPANPPGQTAELQNELIDLGYDLGTWGADDDYGSVTTSAVLDIQGAYGLSPVDGIAGPETRATIDLALGRVPPPMWLSHVAVATGEWIGPVEPPPDPVAPSRLVLGMPIGAP